MRKIRQLIGIFTIVILFTSCSVSNEVITNNFFQKRKYNKGFYVSVNKGKKDKKIKKVAKRSSKYKVDNKIVKNTATRKKELDFTVLNTSKKRIKENKKSSNILDQGNLITSVDKKFISFTNNEISQQQQKISTLIQKKTSQSSPEALGIKRRIRIVAILLALSLGWLGIHRFYLGYIRVGLLQLSILLFLILIRLFAEFFSIPVLYLLCFLITIAFMIWVLTDFLRIIFNDLRPKDGYYERIIFFD